VTRGCAVVGSIHSARAVEHRPISCVLTLPLLPSYRTYDIQNVQAVHPAVCNAVAHIYKSNTTNILCSTGSSE